MAIVLKLPRARGRTGQSPPGQPNARERAYADELKCRQVAGEILWYEYERITFVLVHAISKTIKGQRYTPDFAVMLPDGTIEMHEVKGFRDEKNMNKLKIAAEMFPFVFVLVSRRTKKEGGGWEITKYERRS